MRQEAPARFDFSTWNFSFAATTISSPLSRRKCRNIVGSASGPGDFCRSFFDFSNASEEGQVLVTARFAQEHQSEFPRVVIAPHRTFAVRNLLAGGNVIPAVGAMINRVKEEALMLRVLGKVGFFEKRICHRQSGLAVARAILLVVCH